MWLNRTVSAEAGDRGEMSQVGDWQRTAAWMVAGGWLGEWLTEPKTD